MAGTIERIGYRFIPGPFQYSSGVGALPGFEIRRVQFARPVPLADGFERIAAFLGDAGQPLTAFCACELRSPAQFTDAGFAAFNRQYVGTLREWGIVQGGVNPVARSNVCPEFDKPQTPSFYAFSFVAPSDVAGSFVIAGSGEAREGDGPYRDKTVRYGEANADAISEKMRLVMNQMEQRMAELDAGWPRVTATQVYTVHDIHPSLARDIVAKGAAGHGITWHFCRPPVIGLEYEMDCRAVFDERGLPV
jgi:hypothetical protein